MKSLGSTEQQILANIRESTHWPMEGFISPAALAHVEIAVREYVETTAIAAQCRAELILLANNIRSHLQHVLADARKADDKPYAGKVFKATYDMTSGKLINGSLEDSDPTDEELLS